VTDVVLKTVELTRSFRGFIAVSNVSLEVRRGSVHALIGPNGAGKTTLFNLLTKFLEPSAGRIFFRGKDVTGETPANIARQGIVRSFQISSIFEHLSTLENVRVALQRRQGTTFHFWRSGDSLRSLDAAARALLSAVGLSEYAAMPAGQLSYGRKRALEFATTLALEPEVMLLDEPMAGLGREDIVRISALIRAAAANRTIVMVEHNLSVVAHLCDTITVLSKGEVLAQGSYSEVSANAAVREAYLGGSSE
jgi:branched-chain amino acid transport system ATP-binding protein